jgi:hypothetical protein
VNAAGDPAEDDSIESTYEIEHWLLLYTNGVNVTIYAAPLYFIDLSV